MKVITKIVLSPTEAQEELNRMAQMFLNLNEKETTVYEIVESHKPKARSISPELTLREFSHNEAVSIARTLWQLPACVEILGVDFYLLQGKVVYSVRYPNNDLTILYPVPL